MPEKALLAFEFPVCISCVVACQSRLRLQEMPRGHRHNASEFDTKRSGLHRSFLCLKENYRPSMALEFGITSPSINIEFRILFVKNEGAKIWL